MHTRFPFVPRRGFTLVELLVVMAVMAVIAGIGVFAIAPFQSRSSVNGGAALVQSWLTATKARALRDRAPRGLRLLQGDEVNSDAGTPIGTLVTKAVFFEQPDAILGSGAHHANVANKKAISFDPAPSPSFPTLAGGGFISINGGIYREIESSTGSSVNLKNDFPYELPRNSKIPYRIVPPPPSSGQQVQAATEDLLRMPRGSAINLAAWKEVDATNTYKWWPTASGAGVMSTPLDIVFAPDGSLMAPIVDNDRLVVWVTHTRRGPSGTVEALGGNPSVILVNAKSGAIGVYSVNVVPGQNPYSQVPQ